MHESLHILTTIFLFAFAELLGALCFCVRRSSTRLLVFFILLGLTYVRLYHIKLELTNTPATRYGMACRLAGIIFAVFEPMLKGNAVLEESCWVGDKGAPSQGSGNGESHDISKGEKLDVENASFFKRFTWAFSLYLNSRGSGWAHDNPSMLPPRPSSWSTRAGFLRWQIMQLMIAVLTLELNFALMRRNPYFLGIPAPRDASVILRLAWLAHRGVGQGILAAAGTVNNLSVNAIVLVGLGITEIAAWRPLFGSLSDAYTLRNFWGRVWHQIFRRPFGIIANTLADKMRLKKPSKLRAYFIVCIVFTLSAVLHSFGDFVLVESWRNTKAWTFFLPQIPALFFEDFVISLGRKAGVRRNIITTMLGYVWVIFWIGWVSGPMAEIHAAKGGYFAAMLGYSSMAS